MKYIRKYKNSSGKTIYVYRDSKGNTVEKKKSAVILGRVAKGAAVGALLGISAVAMQKKTAKIMKNIENRKAMVSDFNRIRKQLSAMRKNKTDNTLFQMDRMIVSSRYKRSGISNETPFEKSIRRAATKIAAKVS